MNEPKTRFGYVTILGEPNAGKSTLINALLKSKLSIVTPKPQTTRFRICGIHTEDDAQMVLTDTPGIFKAKTRLEKAMVRAVQDGYRDADLAVIVIDPRVKTALPEQVTSITADENIKKIYVLNKMDLAEDSEFEAARQAILSIDADAEIHVISALKDDGVDLLRRRIMSLLPFSPWHFPADQWTDISERLLASEITREQIFLQLSQEVPYGIHVETESWENFDNGSVKISQAILLSRDSHKPIILGKGGTQIKNIREKSQTEMQKQFDRKVHLFLFVKIRPDWSEQKSYYADMGLEYGD